MKKREEVVDSEKTQNQKYHKNMADALQIAKSSIILAQQKAQTQ